MPPFFNRMYYSCPWCGTLNGWRLPETVTRKLYCHVCKVVHAEADGAAREVRFYLKQTGRVRLEAEDDFE